jgi:hypothetical protein
LAFGGDAYEILRKNLGENEYSKIVKLTHYAHFIEKEKYKAQIAGQIRSNILVQ